MAESDLATIPESAADVRTQTANVRAQTKAIEAAYEGMTGALGATDAVSAKICDLAAQAAGASEEQIKALIDRHGSVFVKPLFKGGVGKKGKAGLLGRAKDLKSALREKERTLATLIEVSGIGNSVRSSLELWDVVSRRRVGREPLLERTGRY